jgi:hypothetical protein
MSENLEDLAVEIEGGAWIGGRHTRGAGFEADIEKYNELMFAGINLLRVTPAMVEDGTALRLIERAFGREKEWTQPQLNGATEVSPMDHPNVSYGGNYNTTPQRPADVSWHILNDDGNEQRVSRNMRTAMYSQEPTGQVSWHISQRPLRPVEPIY